MRNKAFAIDLPEDLDLRSEHDLVIQVIKNRFAAGIWKPVIIGHVEQLREDGGHGLCGQVVFRGAEAAGAHDEVRGLRGVHEGGSDLGTDIPNSAVLDHIEAQLREALCQPRGIGVDDLAGHDFIAL